jgi:hypothetical protein
VADDVGAVVQVGDSTVATVVGAAVEDVLLEP